MWSIRRAASITGLPIPRTRMLRWCGGGWVQARSRIPVTRYCRDLTEHPPGDDKRGAATGAGSREDVMGGRASLAGLLFAAALLAPAGAGAQVPTQAPDVVLYNGKVITLDAKSSVV